jgi:hypothetical protein
MRSTTVWVIASQRFERFLVGLELDPLPFAVR